MSLLFDANGKYIGLQKIRETWLLNAARDLLTSQPGTRVDRYGTSGKLTNTTPPPPGARSARIAVEDPVAPSQPTFPVEPGT